MPQFPEQLADRYRRFKFRHFAPNQDHYERLASEGQSPDVMIVACCDSRVDPETVFSAMPGELFVEYQLAAARMRPEATVCMAAYGDYGPGYIGTEIAYGQGGYETSYVSRTAPEVEKVLTAGMAELLK